MGRRRQLAVVLVIVVILIVGAYVVGLLQPPAVGLADRGDWGQVTEQRTEVVTTVWVDNPNPIGMQLGDGVTASYQLRLNGVKLAEGNESGVSIPTGNTTVELSTDILNDNLPSWWIAYVQNNETIPVEITGRVRVNVGLSASQQFTRSQVLLENATPVITALSRTADRANGSYTVTVSEEELTGTDVAERVAGRGQVTAGYEVRRGWATWGPVTPERTTVRFHFRVHNPGDIPVPALPDGLGLSVDLNDVKLLRAQGDEFEPRTIGRDAVIQPGNTREIVIEVTMDNDKIDEWFTSHVRRDEHTRIDVHLQLVFQEPRTGRAIRVPRDSPVAYTCTLQTGILVDNQKTTTDCGGEPGAADRESMTGPTPSTPDGVATPPSPTPPVTPSPSSPTRLSPTPPITLQSPTGVEEPPTASVQATQTSGEAPLTVTFDASSSSDPNGDIVEYVWRFDDGSPPQRGETVAHTFATPGTYNVRLTVIDSRGNEDTTSVTIEVSEPGIG